MNNTSLLELALIALKHHVEQTRPIEQTSKAIEKLEAAIAEQAKPQEPFGYTSSLQYNGWTDVWEEQRPPFNIPVYLRPQTPKPMSEEEIKGAIARGWCHDKNTHKTMDSDLVIAIANEVKKAIEAHHNIGVRK